MRYYRLCVDIDRIAQPRGCSVEVHDDREVSTYYTLPCGPFTTLTEALDDTLQSVIERYGVQLPLEY